MAAVWSWMNWLAEKARASGKEMLLLNLDETSIPVTFTHEGGNVMLLNPTKNWHHPPRQQSARLASTPMGSRVREQRPRRQPSESLQVHQTKLGVGELAVVSARAADDRCIAHMLAAQSGRQRSSRFRSIPRGRAPRGDARSVRLCTSGAACGSSSCQRLRGTECDVARATVGARGRKFQQCRSQCRLSSAAACGRQPAC